MPKKYIPKYKLKPLSAVIPINCPDLDRLVAGTTICPDRLRVLLHQIYISWIFNEFTYKKQDNYFHMDGWVTLSALRLKVLLTSNYTRYEKFLEEKGIIEIKHSNAGNKSFVQNGRCTPYRTKPSLLIGTGKRKFRNEKITAYQALVGVHLDKKNLEDHVYAADTLKLNDYLPVHEKMYAMFNDFYFDRAGLSLFLSKVESGEIKVKRERTKGLFDAELLTEMINDGSVSKPVICNFGERFHSVFTRLPREFRHFLRVRAVDEPLCSVDIANCQPYLVSLMCSHPDVIQNLLPEFKIVLEKVKMVPNRTRRHFLELCSKGEIYEFWRDERNLAERDDAKDEIIKQILFSSITYEQKKSIQAKKDFLRWFPDVHKSIEVIKSITEIELPIMKEIFLDKYGNFGGRKYYHKTISCMCQRLESRMIIHMVVPTLLKREGVGPFLTIHDSVVLPFSKAEIAKNAIVDCFAALGIKPPKIKIDVYGGIF